MGQTNAIRVQFDPRQLITSTIANARQLMAFTGFNLVGDVVDVEARDARGNRISTVADNLTILSIEDNISVTLSASVDTSVTLPVGAIGYYLVTQQIDDVQVAIDRLYRKTNFVQLSQAIVASQANTPTGKTTLFVNDVDMFQPGDAVDIISDAGLLVSTTVFQVDINADETNNKSDIIVNANVDPSLLTNPKLVTTGLSGKVYLQRLRVAIDAIDLPVENEFLGSGNGAQVAWSTANLFLQGKSKLMLDGRRQRLGTTGTRATLVQGAVNAQLTYLSLVLGVLGNSTKVAIISAAGTTVTVTGNVEDATLLISVTNNTGAATAAQIAAAINADATASKYVQVLFGGTGASVAAAFAATNLAGGLDDGTGDYAEIPQVFGNALSLTGYKWLSFHIRPNDSNRMSAPPRDTEELTIDYRRALSNA